MNQIFEREVVFDFCVIFDFKAGRIKEDIFCLTSSLFIPWSTKKSSNIEKYLAPHLRDRRFETID